MVDYLKKQCLVDILPYYSCTQMRRILKKSSDPLMPINNKYEFPKQIKKIEGDFGHLKRQCVETSSSSECSKRSKIQKFDVHSGGYQTEDELRSKRSEANSRERRRTEELNDAFKQLRQKIPSLPSDKMSKIHTLRISSDYIRYLVQYLEKGEKFGQVYNFAEFCAVNEVRKSFNLWRGAIRSNVNNSSQHDSRQSKSSICNSFFGEGNSDQIKTPLKGSKKHNFPINPQKSTPNNFLTPINFDFSTNTNFSSGANSTTILPEHFPTNTSTPHILALNSTNNLKEFHWDSKKIFYD